MHSRGLRPAEHGPAMRSLENLPVNIERESIMSRLLGHLFGLTSRQASRRGRRVVQKPLRRNPLLLEQLETRLTPSVNVGTVHLTNDIGTIVEETHYAAKPDVYVYGNKLTDGYYDIEVIAP